MSLLSDEEFIEKCCRTCGRQSCVDTLYVLGARDTNNLSKIQCPYKHRSRTYVLDVVGGMWIAWSDFASHVRKQKREGVIIE